LKQVVSGHWTPSGNNGRQGVYRIGRIGTHRHTSERIGPHRPVGPEFDYINPAKEGQGYEATVSLYKYWADRSLIRVGDVHLRRE